MNENERLHWEECKSAALAYLSEHARIRDSRSKPDRAETTQIGSVHESDGAAGNRP